MRLLLAGILGGIIMFAWGAVFHMTVPMERIGVKLLSNEEVLTTAFKENISEPGVYMLPGMNMATATEAEQTAWAAKYQAGPTAFVVYNPTGDNPSVGKFLGLEFASNVVAAILVAFIFALTGATTFVGRVTMITVIGLAGWVSISFSYWNWYRFPKEMILAEGIEQAVGWFISGIVIALIMKPRDTQKA